MNDTQANLAKLQQILTMLDTGVTKDDFVKSFENVVALVLKIEKRNSDAVDALEKTYATLLEKMTNDHMAGLADLKSQVDHVFVGNKVAQMQQEHTMRMAAADTKMASVKDGKDSTVPGPVGPMGKPGKDGSPDSGQMIRNKLEHLTGSDRLDVSAVKGLDEKLKAMTDNGRFTVFGPGKTRIVKVDLSDKLDGTTTVFPVGTHFGIISVQSSSAPFGAWREGIDYKEVGKTIVFLIDPAVYLAAGQSLIVKYVR